MSTDGLSIEELRKKALLFYHDNLEKEKRIKQLELELHQLRQLIAGHQSERLKTIQDDHQISIFNTEQLVAPKEETKPTPSGGQDRKNKKVNRRQEISADLPRNTEILEPEVDTSEMTRIGTVVHEKLEYIPPKIIVHRVERPKYVDGEGNIHIADYENPLPKCNIGPTLASHVIVSKYVDHQPLYRQSNIFARQGIKLARSTLGSTVMRVGRLLEKIYEAILVQILESDYIMADESGIPVLTRDKPGSTLKGCMMVMYALERGLVGFDYIQTKHKANIISALDTFMGHLHVDGNVSYETLGARPEVTLHNCLVHGRRKLIKAHDFDSRRTQPGLEIISQIYRLEDHMASLDFNHDQIKAYRRRYTKPLLKELYRYCQSQNNPGAPNDPVQKAVAYLLKRWIPLTRFLGDGRFKLDTNLLENEIRPMALGRKNYLFCGSHEGAKTAAMFYSFFATCRQNGIDPNQWLNQVITRINSHPINAIHQLIPDQNFRFV